MATYKEIQTYVRAKRAYTPKTCWIAHAKEMCGLPLRRAANRRAGVRMVPCPPDRQEDIREAFEHFRMLETLGQDEAAIIIEAERNLRVLERCSLYELRKQLLTEADAHLVLREAAPARVYDAPVRPSRESEWLLSTTSEFKRSVSRMDRRLKGRILDAINDISGKPTQLRGDTIKPLSGELRGRWRYRIGDYRLIYRPDAQTRTVFLLAVLPRGAAYAG